MRYLLAFVIFLFGGGCKNSVLKPVFDGSNDLSTCDRRIFENEVTNARDIGGWPVTGGRIPCHRLFRGGALTGLTEEGCAEFADLGIQTIIDLREQSVQDTIPSPVCTTKLASHVSAAMPKLLPDTKENYLALLDETGVIRQIFSVLGQSASFPVYWHCEIGRDRASFVTALILLALGVDRQSVMEEFSLSTEAGVAVKPECLAAVLDKIDALGGIETYLMSSGVDRITIDNVRHNAIQEKP